MQSKVVVAVRVRPLSEAEIEEGCSSCLSYPKDTSQIMIAKDRLFTFDHVFPETSSQTDIFNATSAKMIDFVLRGYNATLFAYGQTGSGKTYTMGTDSYNVVDLEFQGLIPRIANEIFQKSVEYPYDYSFKISYLEICGLTEKIISSESELLIHLNDGSRKRVVGGTAMNARSSRSHAVLTIHIMLKPKESPSTPRVDNDVDCLFTEHEILSSKLHLVDLAGSERNKKTQAEGERLKEGININMGLLALGNVINALSEKDGRKRSHIPYRDSKLTRMLQDSLGGNSATIMLACVSPSDSNMDETLNTLRYADRARHIENRPVINRADPKDAELAKLRGIIAQLQARVVGGVGQLASSPITRTPGTSTIAATPNNNRLLNNWIQQVHQLKCENQVLMEELDRASEQSATLYEQVYVGQALRSNVTKELTVLNATYNEFVSYLNDDLPSLTELLVFADKLQTLKQSFTTILSDCSNDSKSIPQSKQSTSLSSSGIGSSESLHEPSSTRIGSTDQCQDETEEDDCDSLQHDPEGSELCSRRQACQLRVQLISDKLDSKAQLLSSLESAKDEVAYAALLSQYEAKVTSLESRIKTLDKERTELLVAQQHANSNPSQQRRIKELERQLASFRQQLADLSRVKQAKSAREAECGRLRQEIQSLKLSRVRSAKQLKEESTAYRKWCLEKEREVRRLQNHDRRLQCELAQMSRTHEHQQLVMRRRIEAAAATEKRLKELLLRQRENHQDKRPTNMLTTKGKINFAQRTRSWIEVELEIQVSLGEARFQLDQLMTSRRSLYDQLRLLESDGDDDNNNEQRSCQLDQINEQIDAQTRQISDLQQKLIELTDRPVATVEIPGSDLIIPKRLAELHNIHEARIAARLLFKEAATAKINRLVTENRATDLELQNESLRSKTSEMFVCLENESTKFRDQLKTFERDVPLLKKECDDAKKEIEQLKRQLEERETEVKLLNERKASQPPEATMMKQKPPPVEAEKEQPSSTVPVRVSNCKCQGNCSKRCGCRRLNQPCLPHLCKCVKGKCENRLPDNEEGDFENRDPAATTPIKRRQLESDSDEFNRPAPAVRPAAKRRRALVASTDLNATFELGDNDPIFTPSNPRHTLAGHVYKHLDTATTTPTHDN